MIQGMARSTHRPGRLPRLLLPLTALACLFGAAAAQAACKDMIVQCFAKTGPGMGPSDRKIGATFPVPQCPGPIQDGSSVCAPSFCGIAPYDLCNQRFSDQCQGNCGYYDIPSRRLR
jgi:hypothetical protein